MSLWRPRSVLQLVLVGFFTALAPLCLAILFTVQTLEDLAADTRAVTRQVVEVTRLGQAIQAELLQLERHTRQYLTLSDPELARLARGETLRLREESFVRAARALGSPVGRILARHILPNLAHVSIFSFTTTATSIVLAESVLTFIGIGVRPGSASWGRMLVEAQTELLRSPPIWWVFSGAAFLGVLPLVVSLNILGERLREILMPESYD